MAVTVMTTRTSAPIASGAATLANIATSAPPTRMTARASRPKTRLMPTLPTTCSPQVRFRRPPLRLTASMGPTPSMTSTVTARKVARFQATLTIAGLTISDGPTVVAGLS